MIGFEWQFIDLTPMVQVAADKASFKNVGHAASSIRKDAIDSIKQAEGPSRPGTPPHTHTGGTTKRGTQKKGHLQKSIAFAENKAAQEAIAGPMLSVVGLAGEAHEKGGSFRGDQFPERPFMGPALQRAIPRFTGSFAGSFVGS